MALSQKSLLLKYVRPPYPRSIMDSEPSSRIIPALTAQPEQPAMPLTVNGRPTKRFEALFNGSSPVEKFSQLWSLLNDSCKRISTYGIRLNELERQRNLGKEAIADLREQVKNLQNTIHAMEMAQEIKDQQSQAESQNLEVIAKDAGSALAIAQILSADVRLLRETLIHLLENKKEQADQLAPLVKDFDLLTRVKR